MMRSRIQTPRRGRRSWITEKSSSHPTHTHNNQPHPIPSPSLPFPSQDCHIQILHDGMSPWMPNNIRWMIYKYWNMHQVYDQVKGVTNLDSLVGLKKKLKVYNFFKEGMQLELFTWKGYLTRQIVKASRSD